VGGHVARQAADEAGQARASAVGEAQKGDRLLHHVAGDVDDAPNRRSIIGSRVALMSMIAASMFASSAAIQSSRDQDRKSPGGGPPALLTRISGWGSRR